MLTRPRAAAAVSSSGLLSSRCESHCSPTPFDPTLISRFLAPSLASSRRSPSSSYRPSSSETNSRRSTLVVSASLSSVRPDRSPSSETPGDRLADASPAGPDRYRLVQLPQVPAVHQGPVGARSWPAHDPWWLRRYDRRRLRGRSADAQHLAARPTRRGEFFAAHVPLVHPV